MKSMANLKFCRSFLFRTIIFYRGRMPLCCVQVVIPGVGFLPRGPLASYRRIMTSDPSWRVSLGRQIE